jgi:hypothetical protein
MVMVFGYNMGMNWVRKGFVGFLSFVLFACLLWGVSAYNLQTKLSHPEKVEAWLTDSGVYDRIITAALAGAQDDSNKNGTSISVSYKDPHIQEIAKSAFSTQLLQTNTNKFIEGNYAWLSGKTDKPQFNLDLTPAKQDFATQVGKYVTGHLSALPACTPEQLAQIQIPVDPSTVTCRPGSLDPTTEGKRVSDEVANSTDFLENPVITANTLNQDTNNPGKPYYEKLSYLPTAYQLGQNLAWILALVAAVLAAAIIFIHPERRKGGRMVGIAFVLAGALLIATKLVSDMLTNKLENAVLTGSVKGQLDQPFTKFLHTAESQLTQSNMLFGIIFVVIGLAILVYLFATREGREPRQKPRRVNTPGQPVETPALSSPENRPQPLVSTNISDRLRPQRPTGPPPLGGAPRPTQPVQRPNLAPTPRPSHPGSSQQGNSQPRPPKPPRLIQ